jgi:hypothetical protein
MKTPSPLLHALLCGVLLSTITGYTSCGQAGMASRILLRSLQHHPKMLSKATDCPLVLVCSNARQAYRRFRPKRSA